MTPTRGIVQWNVAVVVLGMWIGLGVEEHLECLEVVDSCGNVQRRVGLVIHSVDRAREHGRHQQLRQHLPAMVAHSLVHHRRAFDLVVDHARDRALEQQQRQSRIAAGDGSHQHANHRKVGSYCDGRRCDRIRESLHDSLDVVTSNQVHELLLPQFVALQPRSRAPTCGDDARVIEVDGRGRDGLLQLRCWHLLLLLLRKGRQRRLCHLPSRNDNVERQPAAILLNDRIERLLKRSRADATTVGRPTTTLLELLEDKLVGFDVEGLVDHWTNLARLQCLGNANIGYQCDNRC